MDQVRIGKFIAECRKKNGLTQMQLAEKLCITDRAVSKWETGKTMPDSSIMLELCDALNITVNDLLNGERLSSENYAKKVETQLLNVVREKEISDKRLLRLAWFVYILGMAITTIGLVLTAMVPSGNKGVYITLYILVLLPLSCLIVFSWLDCSVGYFQCGHCGHIYKPKFSKLYFANGTPNKRHLRCPQCSQKSWQKRVYTKE